MSKFKKLTYLLIWSAVLTAFMSGFCGLYADSADDCTLYGKLKVNDQDAPAGTLVQAYINDELVVSARTSEIGEYRITIPKYDPSNPNVKGYQSNDDLLTIRVDNHEIKQHLHPAPGMMKVDLNASITLNVKLTTWGKIKALFK